MHNEKNWNFLNNLIAFFTILSIVHYSIFSRILSLQRQHPSQNLCRTYLQNLIIYPSCQWIISAIIVSDFPLQFGEKLAANFKATREKSFQRKISNTWTELILPGGISRSEKAIMQEKGLISARLLLLRTLFGPRAPDTCTRWSDII